MDQNFATRRPGIINKVVGLLKISAQSHIRIVAVVVDVLDIDVLEFMGKYFIDSSRCGDNVSDTGLLQRRQIVSHAGVADV